jgi:hypothetical protein
MTIALENLFLLVHITNFKSIVPFFIKNKFS